MSQIKRPFSWSFSALSSWETCPFRHMKTRVEKTVTEPQTEALAWGSRVHTALEDYVKKRTPLPEGMEPYQPMIEKIVEAGSKPGRVMEAEQKLCLNKDLRPTEYFAKDAYLRVITDLNIENSGKLLIIDYKTGKPNPNSEQLQLSAAAMMQTRPWVTEVKNTFLWLQDGSTTQEVYTREDLSGIWENFLPRATKMEAAIAAGNAPKRPSGLCRNHCPVHSCDFNGQYKGD